MKRQKAWTSLIVFILTALSATAQVFKVSGSVVDEAGSPLSYASVAVEQPPTGTWTDNDGSFTLKLPAGKHILAVGYVGYRTVKREVEVRRDIDTLVIVLQA